MSDDAEVSADAAAAIAALESGYDALLARIVDTVRADDRVRALWLGGSVGRGVADAGSDLDLLVTVIDAEAFADPAVWAVVDPVITIPIPGMPGCFAFTSREGLRVDVVLEEVADVAGSPYTSRMRVLDRDGLQPPPQDDDAPGPDVTRMQALVTEFLRQSAIFPAAVVARGDWLLGQEAVHGYRTLLYELFTESNQPLPVMGVKQWSSRLTADQRAVLTGLQPPPATSESVVAGMVAVRGALHTHGRAALEAAGGIWPTEVDEAITAYWHRHGLP